VQKKGGGVQLKTAIGRVMHTTIRAQNLQSSSELSAKQTGLSQWIYLRMMGTRCGALPILSSKLCAAQDWSQLSATMISLISRSTSTLHLVASSIIGIGPLVKSGVEYEASGYRLPDLNSHSICASLFPTHCATDGADAPLAPGLSVQHQFSTSSVPVQHLCC